MRVVVLVAALLLAAPVQAQIDLFFVGDGSSDTAVRGAATATNFPMSLDTMGKDTRFTTVLGNNIDRNPYLPTYIWDAAPLTFQADDIITVTHFAKVNGGTNAAVGCALKGTLYNQAGQIVKEHIVASTTGNYQTFVFTFTGIEGEFPVVRFQAVQNNNQCGWLGIEHRWGAAAYAGRMTIPTRALFPEPEVVVPSIVYEVLENAEVAASFEAASGTYVYNFTSQLVQAVAEANVNGTGAVHAIVTDGAGKALMNGTLATASLDLGNVTAGDWQVRLELDNFTGAMALRFAAPAPPAEATATADTEAATEEVQQAEDPADTVEESPGAPALLVAAVLAVAVAIRRRR